MSQGRTRGAWLRAGAEFLVIVTGVLVALAVDGWTSDRSDRLAAAQYLEQLAEDVRLDSTLLTDLLMPGVVTAQDALGRVDLVLRGLEPFPQDTVGLLLDVLTGTRGFTQLGSRTTFDELTATGALRLIESPELRAAIVAYYGSKAFGETRAASLESGYGPLVRSYLVDRPTGLAFDLGNEGTTPEALRALGVARAARVLQADGFEQALTRHVNYLALVGPMLQSIQLEAEALLHHVSEELALLR